MGDREGGLGRLAGRWLRSAVPVRGPAMVRHVERAALAAVLLSTLFFTGAYAWIAAGTVGYPDHLEWMEGGIVETVARVRAGLPIYGEPRLAYVPYIYTPLYYWCSAAVGAVIGVDFLACRSVSLLSVLGLAALLFRWVQRETSRPFWALASVGIWCATYGASGKWFHLARVDSLGLFWLVAGLYVLRFRTGSRSALLAACLLFLAFMTKQNSLVAAAPVLLLMLANDARRSLLAGGLLTVLFGLSIAIGQWLTEGRWWFWTFESVRLHGTLPRMVLDFWRVDLWKIAILYALAIRGALSPKRRDGRPGGFLFAMLLGATLASYLARLHSGGYYNVLMPVHYVSVLCAAVGCAQLVRPQTEQVHGWGRESATIVGLCLSLIFQLACLGYSIPRSMPAENAVALSREYVRSLAAIDGEVLIPDRRWVHTRAGKAVHGLGMAARDVLRIQQADHPARLSLERELAHALSERRFAAVVTSLPDSAPGLSQYYRPLREIPSPAPVTGWQQRPFQVWVPK